MVAFLPKEGVAVLIGLCKKNNEKWWRIYQVLLRIASYEMPKLSDLAYAHTLVIESTHNYKTSANI